MKRISKLKPFTLYAFQVEAVVLKNEGAKSDLVFIQTKESGKLGESQRYYNSQNKNSPETHQYVRHLAVQTCLGNTFPTFFRDKFHKSKHGEMLSIENCNVYMSNIFRDNE